MRKNAVLLDIQRTQSKTRSPWLSTTGALTMLALIGASNCQAQNADQIKKTDAKSINVSHRISSTTKLATPGPKPTPLTLTCSNGVIQLRQIPGSDDNSIERQEIEHVLETLKSSHGLTIFKLAQKDVLWWVRVFGSLTVATLPAALHEAHHAVNFGLSACNGGRYAYILNNKLLFSEFRNGDLPQYHVVDRYLPVQFKTYEIGSRYDQYVLKNGRSNRSDYSVLLDELVAYIEGAGFERRIFQTQEALWLMPKELKKLNGNLGGMVDFMLYTLCYLKAVRLDFPGAYEAIKTKSVEMLSVIWERAENELTASHSIADYHQINNVLTFSHAALRTIYSDEYIHELDLLRIKHLTVEHFSASGAKRDFGRAVEIEEVGTE